MSSKPIKIAVIGAHFVGKSTLCKNLLAYLNHEGFNVGLIDEVVRNCPYPINEMTTLEAQNWILDEQKRREKELEKKHDIILMDRCVIDNFAYWRRVAEITNLDKEKIIEKEKEVFKHSKNYDILLFLQPFETTKIKNDGFRSIDPKWRKEMHEIISHVLNKFKSQHNTPIFLLKGSENKMFEEAKNIIKNYLVAQS